MKSIAVAFKSSQAEADNAKLVELHLNVWKVRSGLVRRNTHFFLDFGIMTPTSHEDLLLFLPFKVSNRDEGNSQNISQDYHIEDLGNTICSNKRLLNAIFNENLTATPLANNCFYDVKEQIKPVEIGKTFLFYVLGENNIKIEEAEGGTFIHICIKGLKDIANEDENKVKADNRRCYVRFRVGVRNNNEFVTTKELANDLIQAAFSKKDFFDISINENRDTDPKVLEYVADNKCVMCRFSKIHIFYIADIKDHVENGSSIMLDSRIIESKIWETYIPGKISAGNNKMYMAHHWKSKFTSFFIRRYPEDKGNDMNTKPSGIAKMNLFFTSRYPRLSSFLLIAYLSLALLIGAFASWLGSFADNTFNTISIVRICILGLCVISLLLWAIRALGYKGGFYRKD